MPTSVKVDLKNLSPDALVEFLAGMGKEKFRAGQMMRWIYQRGVSDFAAMTDLANTLRDEGALDQSECFIDATFASAKGGGDEVGPTKRGK